MAHSRKGVSSVAFWLVCCSVEEADTQQQGELSESLKALQKEKRVLQVRVPLACGCAVRAGNMNSFCAASFAQV